MTHSGYRATQVVAMKSLLIAAVAAIALVVGNSASAKTSFTPVPIPESVPKVTAIDTASIAQVVSRGVIRLNLSAVSEPNMTSVLRVGILLGKKWTLIGSRTYALHNGNGKRVHSVLSVHLTKQGLALLTGRNVAKLRFLSWCRDKPKQVRKLVITLRG